MDFKPAVYMEFAKQQHTRKVECNLGLSGITRPYTLEELGVTSRVLQNDAFHPYGNAELKEVIAHRYGVRSEQILIPNGGSSLCNFLLAAALLHRGDVVITETPYYEPLTATVASTGAEIVLLGRRPENDYAVELEELERILHPSVKLIVLTRLHNPTGVDIPEQTLFTIGEAAARIGAYVLVDEVYLDFLPPGSRRIAARIHPHLITTSSLTKVYGMGDLRVGWAVGPKDLIERCWRINNVLGVNPPFITERVALELFQKGGADRMAVYAREIAEKNWSIVERFLSNRSDLHWVKPDGGIIAFIRLQHRRNADAFAARLLEEYSTRVMPGSFFNQPDGFRLGFGASAQELSEGLRRLSAALEE
jgi:aspartate/methionine/tyrosine aminotransferase